MASRELAVLAALARGALGEMYAPEVPGRMLVTIGDLPTASQRRQLVLTLRALSTRAGAAALTGRAVPVSWLSATEAEAVLVRWKRSSLVAQRNLFAALTSLAGLCLYGYPGPARARSGYPGPIGPPPFEARRLQPLSLERDEELRCDVVIVGSGAGGGCVAARLAAAGLDVVVLEKGSYRSESDFHHEEAASARELYLYGMTLSTTDLGCQIIAGSTLGGGTVVNYATSFRTPQHVLREWAQETGIDAFANGEFDRSLDEVSERLGVNRDSSAAGRRDVLLEEGLKKLGWHVDLMPRAVRGCSQDEACGYCGFGCRLGAKQSTMRTYLEDAADEGARIVTRADVRRIVIRNRTAEGVEARVGKHRLRVRARAVVAAGGAIETPALLLRSGLGGQVGRNLHLHPGTAAWGVFEDDVRMWEGTTQARHSNEFRDWDGGYGPIYETVPLHPGAAAAGLPWLSAQQQLTLLDLYQKISIVAVLPRDESSGRVRIARDGNPRVEYKISHDDDRRITEGVVGAGKILEAAGAREVHTRHGTPVSYRPGRAGAHESWAEEVRSKGFSADTVFFSYHQMGSCRMGLDPSSSAIDGSNESHEVRNLFVADASAFPSASGVNPMLTVYGIANRAADLIARRFS